MGRHNRRRGPRRIARVFRRRWRCEPLPLAERQVLGAGSPTPAMSRAERGQELLVRHHVPVLRPPVRFDARPAPPLEHLRALRTLAGPASAAGDALAARRALLRARGPVGAAEAAPEPGVGDGPGVTRPPVGVNALPARTEDPVAEGAPPPSPLGHALLAGEAGLGHVRPLAAESTRPPGRRVSSRHRLPGCPRRAAQHRRGRRGRRRKRSRRGRRAPTSALRGRRGARRDR
jgi:hypothetical protein